MSGRIRRPANVQPESAPLLVARGIQKAFGGVQALKDGNLEVRRREVHAVLGENGAGKSTLVKILSGALQRDAGETLWDGAPVEIKSLVDARNLGIRVIHQRLNVIDHLTVAENLTLGREPRRLLFVDERQALSTAVKALERLGLDLDPNRRAGTLSIAEKQLLEIARALDGEPELLVMDEPTASLGEQEVARLFNVIRRLREDGSGIIYISHKLDEVLAIADRITVLRDGSWVGTVGARQTNPADLVEMMVGHEPIATGFKRAARPGDVCIRVNGISTDRGVRDVTFDLHEGEVLGVYGLMGSGRTKLARAVYGLDPLLSGEILISNRRRIARTPRAQMALGMGYVPEDRAAAILPMRTVRENLTVASAQLIAPRAWIRSAVESRLATRAITSLRIRTPSTEELVDRLSGGNQQKAILGRWLVRGTRILILDDPTSGVDVGAKAEIHQFVRQLVEEGGSILMSSSELPELLRVSDRVLVLHRGRAAGILTGSSLREDLVIRLAISGHGPGKAKVPNGGSEIATRAETVTALPQP